MSKFVIGLLIFQLLGGAYLLSFVLGAGQRLSNARATRLPDPVVFLHPSMALATTGLWVLWMATWDRGWAWAALAAVLLTVGGGLFLFLRTKQGGEMLDRPAADPADVRVAEKQIPGLAIAGHGLFAVTLVVCMLLVALGVVD